MSLPVFNGNQRHAKAAAKLARSQKKPHGIVPRANKIWRTKHADKFYGFLFKAIDPAVGHFHDSR